MFGSKCDDGNLNSNDGCSSTCDIEEHFICRGGNEFTEDYCEDPRALGVEISLNKSLSQKYTLRFNKTLKTTKKSLDQGINMTASKIIDFPEDQYKINIIETTSQTITLDISINKTLYSKELMI